jgi:hypothetical protein
MFLRLSDLIKHLTIFTETYCEKNRVNRNRERKIEDKYNKDFL